MIIREETPPRRAVSTINVPIAGSIFSFSSIDACRRADMAFSSTYTAGYPIPAVLPIKTSPLEPKLFFPTLEGA
jgi:hypothetical protein